jgi:predicted signal transduction protein with EAL and GGDEF domain
LLDIVSRREAKLAHHYRLAVEAQVGNPRQLCWTPKIGHGDHRTSQVRVDIFKIEQAAVVQLCRNGLSTIETSALSALIRAADVAVIAEGVESADQVSILRDCGISLAQGWHFSHPLAAGDFGIRTT